MLVAGRRVFVSNCMHRSSIPCSLKAFHTLLCSSVSKAFLEVDGYDPQRLVPLGGSLSELLERGGLVGV